LESLGKALDRLQEAVKVAQPSGLVIDGTIQRFEFTIELFWKMLKRCLAYEGIETNTPRESLQKAFQVRWIDDETLWLQMLRDRNLTSHVYDEKMALRIFQRIQRYYPVLRNAYQKLQAKFASIETHREEEKTES